MEVRKFSGVSTGAGGVSEFDIWVVFRGVEDVFFVTEGISKNKFAAVFS